MSGSGVTRNEAYAQLRGLGLSGKDADRVLRDAVHRTGRVPGVVWVTRDQRTCLYTVKAVA